MTKEELLNTVKFDKDGLVPVIAQDYHSKHIRMLAYMNKEALEKTLETGDVYYYSRSRQKLWHKGEESGHFQHLKGMSVDCDGDTLLIQIEQVAELVATLEMLLASIEMWMPLTQFAATITHKFRNKIPQI